MATPNSDSVLTLIAFKGFLYPSDTVDYEFLRTRGYPTYRIPLSTLPMLRKTRLAKATINIVGFMEMWQPFAEHFAEQLTKYGDVNVVSPHEQLLRTQDGESKSLDTFIKKTNLFVHRYCIALQVETKEKKNADKSVTCLKRLRFIYNPEINNSYSYVNYPDKGNEVELLLASGVKIKFYRRMLANQPMLGISVADRQGDHWSEVLNRTGKYETISKEQIEELAHFLLDLR